MILSLSGLVGAVVGFFGFLASGNSPDANAAPAQVVKWYADHTNGQNASTVLLGVAGFLLIVFGAVLYVGLRDDGVSGIASLVGFAGAMLLAVALAIGGGVTLSLTDSPTGVSPITEQALNALSNDVYTPLWAIALVAFGAGFGTALIATRRLPTWLGIVGIIIRGRQHLRTDADTHPGVHAVDRRRQHLARSACLARPAAGGRCDVTSSRPGVWRHARDFDRARRHEPVPLADAIAKGARRRYPIPADAPENILIDEACASARFQ